MGKNVLRQFEKNKYFYGKLLTVRDFETEQKYFTGKRNLMNKLMYGSGVVSGLQVIQMGEDTLYVEPGVAIDNMGREIVISSPAKKKLSLMEGFVKGKNVDKLYLCVKFDENEKEPVYAAKKEEGDSKNEYNRIQEAYKLYVTENEPAASELEVTNLTETFLKIYEDENVVVNQIVPRYVKAGEIFDIKVEIRKKQELNSLYISYDLGFSNIKSLDGARDIKFEFDESSVRRKEEIYNKKISLRADTVISDNNILYVKEEKVLIGDNGEVREKFCDYKTKISITNDEKRNVILETHFDRSLNESLNEIELNHIYLAKINLIQSHPKVVVDSIEVMPFKQYVYNNHILRDISKIDQSNRNFGVEISSEAKSVECDEKLSVEAEYDEVNNNLNFKFEIPKAVTVSEGIATGVYEQEIKEKFILGKNIITEEIEHGLGVGSVVVTVGIEDVEFEERDNIPAEETVYYGNPDVFYKTEYESALSEYATGVIAYPKKGSFRIGLRLQSSKKYSKVKLRWWAYKNMAVSNQMLSTGIFIEPDTIELYTGEQFKFEARVINGRSNVIWKLEDKNGGKIDDEGNYTAPQTEGTYKIIAENLNDKNRYSVAYAVVKEMR